MKTPYIPIFWGLLALPGLLYAQERPAALRKIEVNRTAIKTAHIEWSRIKPEAFGGHPRFYTIRLSEEESVITNRGDEDGVFNRLPDGAIDKIQMKPYSVLSKDGKVWLHHELDWSADYFPDGAPIQHPRALGLCSGLPYYDIQSTLWHDNVEQPSPRVYSERQEDKYHVVRAESDLGELEWWLDPECGGEVVRFVQLKHGKVISETRCKLKNFDGVWFPESTAFFDGGYHKGKEPTELIRIHYASFNQPEQPRTFSPKDIGVVAGVHIQTYTRQRELVGWDETYDGEKIVSDTEFLERWKRKEIELGPTMQREAELGSAKTELQLASDKASRSKKQARPQNTLSIKDKRLTEWEEYTRRFIAWYRLDDDQTQKAWLVCLECQAQARGHLAKIKSRLVQLESRLKTQRESGDKASGKQLTKLEEQRRDLLQPITKIFERQLKPRLEKLPTRAQRKAVQGGDNE